MHLYRIAARSYIGSLGMEAFVLARLISVDLPLSLPQLLSLLSLSISYPPSHFHASFSGPRSTTPEVNSPRSSLEAGKIVFQFPPPFLSRSLARSAYFSLSLLLHLFLFSLRRQFRESMLAHARSAFATIRFIIIPLFFAGTHKLPFFLWISRALCVPLLPLMSRARFRSSYTSPLSHHSMTIYSGYVTFVAKNTFCPGQLLMNGHTREIRSFMFLFRGPFFCFRNSWQSTSTGAYRLVITILVS